MKSLNSLLPRLALVAAGIVLWPGVVYADTTNLISAADTYLRSNAADNNFGGSPQIAVGNANNGSSINHALFRFDLSFLPTNAIVTDATFTVTVVQQLRAPDDFDLHRMLVSWAEFQCNWTERSLGVLWGGAGCLSGTDYAAAVSDTATLNTTGTSASFNSPSLTADVQAWVSNPASNFGWFMKATGEALGSGKQVGSRDYPNSEPALAIEYIIPGAPPASLVLFDAAAIGNQFRFSFNAKSNASYTVESRGSLGSGSWLTLTNLPAQPADTTLHFTNPMPASPEFYRVRTP